MILVYLDIENNKVIIIENNTFFNLNFNNFNEISSLLSNKEVHYVTNIDIVSGESVISLISQISGQKIQPVEKSSGIKYLHSKIPQKANVPGDNEILVLEGLFHFIPLDKELSLFKKFPILDKLLKSGKVEIVDDIQKKKILSETKKDNRLEEAKKKALDNMLIKTSVNDFINKKSSNDSDAIIIDVSSEKSFKKEQEQEVYSNLNKLGIRIDE